MRKNIRMKQTIAAAMAVLVTASTFSIPVSANAVTNVRTTVSSVNYTSGAVLEDGIYSIPVKMWHATKDQASSGNGALQQTARLIVQGGKAQLVVTYLPMISMGKTTYVSELNYLTDMVFAADGSIESFNTVPSTVLSTYDVVDEYNAADSKDPTVAGKLYPKDQMIPVELGTEEVYISIYVPISAPFIGYGKLHEARLILDYDNITAVEPSVTLSKTEATLLPNESVKLSADVVGLDSNVVYSSSNEKVAKVDSEGNVTAVMPGSAVITATANGVSATCNVKVSLADGAYEVPVSLWHATKDEASMGNAGMEQSGVLVVKDGKATLHVSFFEMSFGIFKGYLSELNLMTNIQYNSYNFPEKYDKVPATVISTYDTVDQYNAPNSTDVNCAGKLYPKMVSIPVELGEEYTWVHMYVPVMGELGAGDCEARIKLNYSSLQSGTFLRKTEATLTAGESISLKDEVFGLAGDAVWASSNTNIATVDQTGTITAVSAGTATITLTSGGKTSTCQVTVKAQPSIQLNQTKATIYTTGTTTVTLTATVTGDSKDVTWTSSDSSIATVSNGVVTAKKAGTVTVTATANGKSVSADITVVASSIKLDKTSATIYTTGTKTVTLKATVVGASQTVTWKSSNTSIATVSNGKVTAKKAGTVTITATANGVSKTVKVTVKAPAIKLNKSKATIYTKGTTTVTLKATVTGSSKTVTWKSSNTKVATVKNGKVTAKKAGKVKITATANGVSKSITVTVKAPTLKVAKSSVTLKVGKTSTIKATATPAKTITYKSSNTKVATVSKKGVIKAKKKGTAKITVTCNGVKKTVKVTVK